MVAKKKLSKRISSSRRNKNEKNAKEHHRKQRKEARANPTSHHKKLKKDPGIPNLFPFKEKLLHQIAEQKAAQMAEKLTEKTRLKNMLRNAQKRGDEFESEQVEAIGEMEEVSTSGRKDDSRKAYYKEFKKVVEQADVILQVLDVRDPLGCRSKQIEEMILNAGAGKRIILVLNKIDLVPREVVEQWLKYLRNEYPTIAFKASTQSQKTHLSRSKVDVSHASAGLLSSSECLGADTLMKLLKNYCRNNQIKTSITVGVVGFPNVGKSSVINSLKRARVCNVGATPGLTKLSQEIHLDKHIRLIDSPGIVFSRPKSSEESASSVLRNCIKVELVADPIAPVQVILDRCSKESLMVLYTIPYFSDVNDFLVHIARSKGRIRKGGIPDVENAARCILQDWNAARIPYYTIPPASGVAVTAHVNASIVATWAKEFELDELKDTEVLESIKGKSEMGRGLVMTSGGVCDEEMDEGDSESEDEEIRDEMNEESEEDSEMEDEE